MQGQEIYSLIETEALIARGALCTGLTALRAPKLRDKAVYYSGFINMWVGLERLMRLIIIADHTVNHDLQVPSASEMSSYGSGLLELYSSCELVARRLNVAGVVSPAEGTVHYELLDFFSSFAGWTFDSSPQEQSDYLMANGDPRERWIRILAAALAEDAVRRAKTRKHQSKSMGSLTESFSTEIQLNDLEKFERLLSDTWVPHTSHERGNCAVVLRIFEILRPLIRLASAMGHLRYSSEEGHSQTVTPYLSEFFSGFGSSPSYLRRKKRWP